MVTHVHDYSVSDCIVILTHEKCACQVYSSVGVGPERHKWDKRD